MTAIYNLSSIPDFHNIIDGNDVNNTSILKVNEVVCDTNNSSYRIIRYRKNMLTIDMIPLYGLCRSIIVNSKGKVVCFAPPKSISYEEFSKKYPLQDEHNDAIVAEEFVEGTMINAFFDQDVGTNGDWVIATRNNVGANCSFYRNPMDTTNTKTFHEMFMEAAHQCNLNFHELDSQFCYSFVLQHPENRIVIPILKPKLYLVGVYKIINDSKNITVVNNITEPNHSNISSFYEKFSKGHLGIEFPKTYQFNSYTELTEKYGSTKTPYDVMGVVIYNKITGERTKIRNPIYERVRHLRGNQPKLQYQYLCLRQGGRVSEFLHYYPENKKYFSAFRNQVHLFTHTLFHNYVSCYIKKEKPLMEYLQEYRSHMFQIHQIYMAELREKKLSVTNLFVQKYINELEPSILMHSLNYQNHRGSNHKKFITPTDEEHLTMDNAA